MQSMDGGIITQFFSRVAVDKISGSNVGKMFSGSIVEGVEVERSGIVLILSITGRKAMAVSVAMVMASCNSGDGDEAVWCRVAIA